MICSHRSLFLFQRLVFLCQNLSFSSSFAWLDSLQEEGSAAHSVKINGK